METHYHKFSNSSSSDENQITQLIDTYGQGFIDKDVDKIMDEYTVKNMEDFKCQE